MTFYSSCRSGRRFGQPRAAEITCCTLARLRTAHQQLCQSHDQVAAETDSTQPPNANRQQLVSTGCASPTTKMRTYDDSFSGQKIYPGKVCLCPPLGRQARRSHLSMTRHDAAYRIETNEFAAYLYVYLRMAG